jgi:hypothetical protein
MAQATDLTEFIAHLRQAELAMRPYGENWNALIERISIPGHLAEIAEETYWYFLEVLPPKYQCGPLFAFAEGAEPLRIFFANGFAKGSLFFCRQLTWDETKEFCRLASVRFPYW